jgi:hypothetical protein
VDGASQAFGLAGNGHASHGADFVARGVVGWKCGRRKKNHGNVLQAGAGLHNGAEILAGDVLAFCLCKDDVRCRAVQNVERLLCRGDSHDMVAILFKHFASCTGSREIRDTTQSTRT